MCVQLNVRRKVLEAAAELTDILACLRLTCVYVCHSGSRNNELLLVLLVVCFLLDQHHFCQNAPEPGELQE